MSNKFSSKLLALKTQSYLLTSSIFPEFFKSYYSYGQRKYIFSTPPLKKTTNFPRPTLFSQPHVVQKGIHLLEKQHHLSGQPPSPRNLKL